MGNDDTRGAQDPQEALAETEDRCMDKLCEVLGLRKGIDALIGLHSGRLECVVFDIGYLMTGDQTAFPAHTFHFRAKLEMFSRSRRTIQRWIMRMLLAMPIAPTQGRSNDMARDGNVVVFRIAPETNAIGEVSTTAVKQNEADKGTEVFYAVASFDVVFTVKQARS